MDISGTVRVIVALIVVGPLSESRQFRGSIRRPVPKNQGFQCNPGIDGGVEQQNMAFQFVVSFLNGNLCIIAAITSGAP